MGNTVKGMRDTVKRLRFQYRAMGVVVLVLLSHSFAWATTYNVKTTGSDANTCVQAQSAATPKLTIASAKACMATPAGGDTVVVFAGTYNESPSIPAGSSGSYNTLTVNGSDVVQILGVTLASHTKIIGNCPTKQGTVTTATCGFFITNPSSPTTSCVALGNGVTDVFIRNNVMYACGSIGSGYSISNSFIYIQGNTVSYMDVTVGTVTSTCPTGTGVGNPVQLYGDHFLIEDNDFSHYNSALYWNPANSIARNNSFHDVLETQGIGNCHTDTWFSDPGNVTSPALSNSFNVYEGNTERNAVGANAKGPLSQRQFPSSCPCDTLINRFNVTNRIGSGSTTNNQNWLNVKVYNNTTADANSDAGTLGLVTDNSWDSSPPGAAFLNQIYYYSNAITSINPYDCATAQCNFGNNLVFCSAGCTTIYSHQYQIGSFTGDTGNKNADPKFVNYVAAANAANDYHLQTGSPAIAAGTFLTTVAAGDTGTGTSLIVNDAHYFQDGYGLTNPYTTVQGDCIAVGTVSNTVCITAVNYATNTLTLAGSISRSSGDHIWLYSKSDAVRVLYGSAPDMGAFPYSTVVAATAPKTSSGNSSSAGSTAQ